MGDPRVNGTFTGFDFVGHESRWPGGLVTDPPSAALGRLRLANEEGSWLGNGSGVYAPGMGQVLNGWLAGEGPYEGQTLYLHAVQDIYSTPEMSFEGVVFEGHTPHMLEAFEVPAE